MYWNGNSDDDDDDDGVRRGDAAALNWVCAAAIALCVHVMFALDNRKKKIAHYLSYFLIGIKNV